MPKLADNLATRAKELIEKYGMSATLIVNDGTYEPSTGEVVSADQSHSAKASPPGRYSDGFVADSNVRQGDVESLVAADSLSVTPLAGNRMDFNDKRWTVIDVEPIVAQDRTIAYLLQLRK